MRAHEFITEAELDEINWRKGLATGALALGALGAMGQAHGRVSIGPDGQPTKSFAQQMSQQADQDTADRTRVKEPSAEMPNQNLQKAERVERSADGIVVHFDGKEYQGIEVPKDSPTPRGAKAIKIDQAQMGKRGIGNYTTYLLPNGKAFIYSK